MTVKPFVVDQGLLPGHTGLNIGHSTNKFNDAHFGGDLAVGGDVSVAAGGSVTIGGVDVGSGGGGGTTGGLSDAEAIAYSVALG